MPTLVRKPRGIRTLLQSSFATGGHHTALQLAVDYTRGGDHYLRRVSVPSRHLLAPVDLGSHMAARVLLISCPQSCRELELSCGGATAGESEPLHGGRTAEALEAALLLAAPPPQAPVPVEAKRGRKPELPQLPLDLQLDILRLLAFAPS
ncbi:hypothetical protein WJX81_003643 [Elliptochloris bilobata]|uniref:Uncharacterized protein n=1 Tax=Elliptochloris bilobata TaxID=381761 RepID=A0AAW1RPP1_9CHLO